MGCQPMGLGPSDVVFSEATAEQRQIAWELNGASWAAPMPPDTYAAYKGHLSQRDLTKDSRCRYWVLYLKGYPRQIIASCETTRKALLISENGVSREGFGCAIASLFTNPDYRRLGMAGCMLRRLQEQMDVDDSECSVLYSDIGKLYYATLGWKAFPSKQVTLSLLPSPSSTPVLGPKGDDETVKRPVFRQSEPDAVRYLQEEELNDLCEVDEMQLSAEFDQMPADGSTHIAFLPSYAQISWQLARSEFVARTLFEKTPTYKGAITNDAQSWLYWGHDWREKKLKILRIVHGLSTTVEQRIRNTKSLLEAALVEADTWGLPRVLVWNPDEVITRGCKAVGNAYVDDVKIVFDERADASIPSLRWSKGKDVGDTVWESNFSYCWC